MAYNPYYISNVKMSSPADSKCKVLQGFVRRLQYFIQDDAAAVDTTVEWLQRVVEELNERYPRTKRLEVQRRGDFVCCRPVEHMAEDEYVFSFDITSKP